MSLFRKPKKTIQRRVFSTYEDEDIENDKSTQMEVDEEIEGNERNKEKRKDKKSSKERASSNKPTSLLSFDNDDEEGETFQVKKSSHSKKVMKMLDKERKKKKYRTEGFSEDEKQITESIIIDSNNKINKKGKNDNSNSIQTEIRTDDFVLVVKKTEKQNLILNGRAALCAGKDDLSSEDEEIASEPTDEAKIKHKFSHPDNFKMVLESGKIPDAAMIHAARKSRQKAREQGDFIPIEEQQQKEAKKGNRLIRDDGDDDCSEEEERVDMANITGIKEREERKERFYSAQQQYSGDESDLEMNEWENQQIRKGVTGAQLVTAHQESVFSQFMIQPLSAITAANESNLSSGALLEQAYAKGCLEKPRQILLSTQHKENKPCGPRMPHEVVQKLHDRLVYLKEINLQHYTDIEQLTTDLKLLKTEELSNEQCAPLAACKYRFYQELRGYVNDLVECLDEKIPQISELELKVISVMGKKTNSLVERRRQDVRDQAKEMADVGKPGSSRKGPEDDEHIRRTAEREGRRTRRRRDRERSGQHEIHLDGMSSDDEIADQETSQYKIFLEGVQAESSEIFNDASDEFSQIKEILKKFESWKKFELDSYKDAYVTLCLPKIIGPILRLDLLCWSPLEENSLDLEKMHWFSTIMKYGYVSSETEESLLNDPDVKFVPSVVEKIILPKITEHIENCWDPLSTTQTFKLVGLIGRLVREYPSLRPASKSLKHLFTAILDKMKLSLENDVFIPIFPKHMQEARTSFFQRQFCSGLKLFRNLISWQGILSDVALRDFAISSLLNRYLLSAMRVCTPIDATTKAYIIINTLPRIWLHPENGILDSLEMFTVFLKHISNQLDKNNLQQMESFDKIQNILLRLHANF